MVDPPRFANVPKLLTARGSSSWVSMPWESVPDWIRSQALRAGIDLNPIFQRGRVWSREQKIKYLEFRLAGGTTGKDIHVNNPAEGWRYNRALLLMDGKQRLDAVLEFLNDELPVFGHRLSEYADRPDYFAAQFQLYVHNFTDHNEILQWYCDMNRGGVVHSDAEIERVQSLIGQDVSLVSSPEVQMEELSRYPVLKMDDEIRWMAGAHLCGQPGMRTLRPDETSFQRWEECPACLEIYWARHPKPAPQPTPAKPTRKPRKRLSR